MPAKIKQDTITLPTGQVVTELAKLGCTIGEIAMITKTNKRSLWREFRTEWDAGHGDLVKKLRGAQIDKALTEKNAQMLIHLGKHYLSQSDAILVGATEAEDAVEEMDSADLIALVKKNSE